MSEPDPPGFRLMMGFLLGLLTVLFLIAAGIFLIGVL